MNIEVYNEMIKNEKEYWWFKSRRKIIKNTIKSLNLNTAEVLEIGSGTGGNIDMLKSLGKLTLVECSEHAIALTKEAHGMEPIHACLPDKEQKFDQKFDLICMLDVLEHIETDKETLDSLDDLLSEEGSILITVPAYQWLWSNHDVIHQHKKRYTISQLKELTKDKYDIKYISYMNFFLAPLIMIARGLGKVLPKKEDSHDEILKIGKMNGIFESIFSFETKLIPKFRLPFGISIIMVLEKKKLK